LLDSGSRDALDVGPMLRNPEGRLLNERDLQQIRGAKLKLLGWDRLIGMRQRSQSTQAQEPDDWRDG
jgi:hypothetical protein